MFGGGSFVSLGGAGGQVRLAQAPAYAPAAPAPASAPVQAPVPVAPPAPVAAPAPIATASGISHGAQVAVAATLFGLTILGAIFLTD